MATHVKTMMIHRLTTPILDQEILERAMQHDLPIIISIDGSLDEYSVVTTSISIVAPDINDHDEVGSLNWQHRIAKLLLIHSWRLPKQWGTSQACINMAESIGFILGEYTIPSDLPIMACKGIYCRFLFCRTYICTEVFILPNGNKSGVSGTIVGKKFIGFVDILENIQSNFLSN
jgi:hypothetical protein